MHERLLNLFSKEKLDKLGTKNILLVGIGGVGSFCFESLIRSGIKNITVIDFDIYEESNLNRQLYATKKTIDTLKIESAIKRANEIDENIQINVLAERLDNNSNIDFSKYDYIIDACDSVPAKALLIIEAFKHNIKIISSLGIGNRVSPKNVQISTLKSSLKDPLGKKLNHYLIKNGFNKDVPVVMSDEVPIKSKVIASYVCVTSVAGIMLADYVIKDIINE